MFIAFVKRWSVVTVLGTAAMVPTAGIAADTEWASVRKYKDASGAVSEAVMLKAQQGLGDVARQHVILIDTSASQIGAHKKHTLGVLKGLLSGFGGQDRVRLLAVDVTVESLTPEFVAPQSDAISAAIDELQARIPLGATDLISAIDTARGMLTENEPGSIIYIGDGISSADVFQASDVQALVDKLRQQNVALHSYGVGPQLNLHLLGIFAQQTGGVVQFDSGVDKPHQNVEQAWADRGQTLAKAVSLPVYRPEQLTAPEGVALLPHTALPLRADRDTIYLVRGELPAEGTLTAKNARATETWKLAAPVSGPEEAYLAALVNRVEQEGELANSLAGVALLNVARDEFQGRVAGLVNYGKLAFQKQDLDRVQQAVDAVRDLDPANQELAGIERATRKLQGRTVALVQNDAAEEQAPAADSDLEPLTEPNPESSLLADEQRAIRIRTQKLRQQVNDLINVVRRVDDPQAGLDEIDRLLGTIRSAIDIEPETRSQLEKQLRSERLSQLNRQQVLETARIHAQVRRSQREAQERLADRLALEETKLTDLIDRVRSLVEEGRHGDDAAYEEAEVVARVAGDLRPGDGTTSAAIFDSEAALQLNRSFRLRSQRSDQLLDTLHQVELSHIPFPDEPPIRFPPASVWAALTERRRKWATVDLKHNSPNEDRIQNALNETTEVSFDETSLRDALDYIEDLHGINIIINTSEIDEGGGSSDVQITLELSGVLLRSALKLMLEPHELTYVIQDEVMQITTIDAANEKLNTRVYPVGDLTINMMSGGGGMGGMGGGMMGGMGGGMGGMGGGMGGMGGGMGGMGGGMGGGMFSVPPEQLPLLQKKKQ